MSKGSSDKIRSYIPIMPTLSPLFCPRVNTFIWIIKFQFRTSLIILGDRWKYFFENMILPIFWRKKVPNIHEIRMFNMCIQLVEYAYRWTACWTCVIVLYFEKIRIQLKLNTHQHAWLSCIFIKYAYMFNMRMCRTCVLRD